MRDDTALKIGQTKAAAVVYAEVYGVVWLKTNNRLSAQMEASAAMRDFLYEVRKP